MKLTRLAACVLLFFVGGTASAGQPHVVFIIADDIGWNDLGCYGSPSSRTPNIDAFAETATRFDNAYLTASSCSPSRASLLLGRYPHNCGKAGELHRPMPEHLVGTAFTALLREAGYHAELVGKHHMSVERPDGSPRPLVKPAFDAVARGRVRGNKSGAAPWAETIRDRPTDRPCVFWFASSDAHRPWDGDLDWDAAKYGPKHDPAAVVPPAPMPDTPETRQDFASYLNEVTRFDYFVGEVLATLAGEGIADDTVVIVTSDNGRPFPRAKTRLHDPGMKMPLLVRLPAEYRQPATTDALASAVDVAPTVLDLCGVAVPETQDGRRDIDGRGQRVGRRRLSILGRQPDEQRHLHAGVVQP
ncbi:MAG: sulfatase, partial [Planctomycetota bacterium]